MSLDASFAAASAVAVTSVGTRYEEPLCGFRVLISNSDSTVVGLSIRVAPEYLYIHEAAQHDSNNTTAARFFVGESSLRCCPPAALITHRRKQPIRLGKIGSKILMKLSTENIP